MSKLGRLTQWPDTIGRRQAQGLPKMRDGAVPEIPDTEKRCIGRVADLAHGL
jgi:hypothetical protein